MFERKNRATKERGFSLVELLVVIVIIAILVTVAVFSFNKIQKDTRDDKRSTSATIISEALEKYYKKNGEYPSVASIANQPINNVKTKLSIADTDVLLFPQATSTTVSAIVPTDEDVGDSVDKIAYNGESVIPSEAAQCQTNLNGGCDQYILRWQNEDGSAGEIKSREGGRDVALALSAPTTPTITAALVGGALKGTVTNSACSAGTIEYKISISTTDDEPNWSSLSWQAGNTKNFASPVAGSTYYLYTIAHCIQGTTGVSDPSDVAQTEYYYAPAGTPTVAASWDATKTSAIGTATPSSACAAGLTIKYYIQYKIDTTTTAGSWTVGQNWTTSPSYTIASANTSNPRKFSFQAKARCDNGATAGPETVLSNTDFVISAPAPAVVSNTSSTSSTTWTWPAVSCPVGTTPVYTGAWTGGNFNAYPAMTNPISSGINMITTSQGFKYGLTVSTSCGSSSAKILAGASTASTYDRPIPTMNFRTARAGMRTYQSATGSPKSTYVYARVDSIEPNSGVTDAQAVCATGLTRVMGWATSKNDGGWSPAASATQFTKNEVAFPHSSSANFYYESDLDAGDQLEARFSVRCKNATTSVYAPTSSGYKYDDRVGNLIIVNNTSGSYHILCDPRASVSDSLKSPIWCKGGNTSGDDATGTCTLNSDDSTSKCFSHVTAKDAWSWSWGVGQPAPPSTSPNRIPASSWGLTR